MLLTKLLKNSQIPDLPPVTIREITLDSRKVTPNSLFVALKGSQQNGDAFIQSAIEQGASAILKATSGTDFCEIINQTPIVHLQELSKKVGDIAAEFYGHPSKNLKVIGVTGTNGKTSCTHFLAQILNNIKQKTGIIGTLGYGFYGDLKYTGLTTPDAITLQNILREFFDQKANMVAMEVSSHSIHQHRINGIDFEVGLFTNLTQDHLDYHGTMENYANTKRSFLADFPIKNLVINMDDEYGSRWLEDISHSSMIAYGFKNDSFRKKIPKVFAKSVELSLYGIHAELVTPWGNSELALPLIGEFNLSNALAVITSLCAMNVSLKEVVSSMKNLSSVPGRMEVIKAEKKPLIIVDYAHTPDALQKVLQALRRHTSGKLICVFGCGGDRDSLKRPRMGRIAEIYADQTIITNDNPRHEQPLTIAEEILSGFQQPNRVAIELDRSKAIANSIQLASENDCVLIAGKGAERDQQIGDERFPFDDVQEVKRYLGI